MKCENSCAARAQYMNETFDRKIMQRIQFCPFKVDFHEIK